MPLNHNANQWQRKSNPVAVHVASKNIFLTKYVQQAKNEGLRSRASSLKIEEIIKKDNLIKTGMMWLILGASPEVCSQQYAVGL